jgi:hypothetical protein
MQTFIPQTSSFEQIAQELDNKRLNKQVLEAWQLMLVLTSLNPQGEHRDPKGWRNHPAAKMWEGHEKALALYATIMCDEWLKRGYKSTMIPKINATFSRALELGRAEDKLTFPWWMQDTAKYEEMASTHRVALLRKEYEWYSKFGWPEDNGYRPAHYQYLWPDNNGSLYLGTFNAA